METLRNVLLKGIVCMMALASCQEEKIDKTPVSYPKDVEITDFSLTGTPCRWGNTLKWDSLYIVNSGDELLTILTCSSLDYFPLDFNKNTLLHISGRTPNIVVATNRQFEQVAPNRYCLKVDVIVGMATQPGYWVVAFLTPKLTASDTIQVEVKKNM